MSSKEKVIQYHISRLKDKNPEVLLKTIQELAQFGKDAADALPLLESLFWNSEDVSVKKAAQYAGRVILQQIGGNQEAS
ncbi:MAG: HEAT repeat domain-containing protein [Anaerolineales bacterium]|nr:HEAT repeat domain-containing protein [Anaerolineales bacterium]